MSTTTAAVNPATTWTRGAALGCGYLTRRPRPASVVRIVANMAALPVGTDTSFGCGAAHVAVWRPRVDTWVLQLIEVTPDFDIAVLRTIGIGPGQHRALEAVYTIHGGPLDGAPCIAGEFRSVEAALGFALEHVTTPVLAAGQHDPDPCGV